MLGQGLITEYPIITLTDVTDFKSMNMQEQCLGESCTATPIHERFVIFAYKVV